MISLTNTDPDTTICIGDNVDFNAFGGTDYEFFIGGVSQGPPSTTSSFSSTGLANGVSIDAVGSTLGCASSSNNFLFTVYGYPVVSLTNNSDTTMCAGELTDLVAAGATNYQFYVNSTPIGVFGPVTTFNNALNNGDIVTVEGETNGCLSPSVTAVTYVVYTYPTLSSTSTATTICINDTATFNASGAMTYDFALNGTTIQSGASSTLEIGTLENGDVVTITGYNGDCASSIDTYNFTVNSMNLELSVAASSMVCAGENVTFTGTGADEYEFFLNGVSQGVLSATNTFSSSTLNDLDEITFTAYSTSTLCTQSYDDYILMNVIDEPTINPLSNIEFCEGDSVILVSNLEYGNQWYIDGNIITGATDTSYTAFTSGAYSLETVSGGSSDVWSFGQNATGTFGNGSNLNSADPTIAVTTELMNQLSSGYDFVLGVTSTNEVYAWGENSSGQLGDGSYTGTNLPQLVPTLANIKNVATSKSSSMAVDAAGNTYVWGNNNIGQLATGNTNVVNFPFANPALTNVDSIAGGKSHFIILRNDGTVWAVGDNNNGQLGQGNLTNSMNAVQVPGLANIVSVGAGEYHSFAIDNNGNLYVWGNNGSGQLGLDDLANRLDPTLSPLENVINAQGGAAHSAFLTSDEKVFTAGDNSFGQLGTGNFTNSTVAIQVGVSGADMISTGQYTTLVKRADMSVFGFGNNTEDQLSLTGLSVNTPEHIIDLDGVSFIEASKSSSHVIYSTTHLCSSQDVDVNMLTTPLITITAVNDLLSTMSGTSYQWYFNGNPIPGETNQTMIATQTGDYTVEVTFANGCTGVSDVYFFSMVSLENLTFENVNVFPNPTNGLINIQLTQELNELTYIKIRDQAGRLVKEVEFNNGNLLTINVSELENGIYHILIQNASVSGNIRFVKTSK
jgi:alpha-tubulin suppressor-like RCC1 family protein